MVQPESKPSQPPLPGLEPGHGALTQGLSLLLSLASALAVTLDPRLVAASVAELRHSELMFLLLAISLCLVQGVGFRFRQNTPGRWLTHPLAAWSLLALAWWKLLH